jgi:sucrose phosphorylase
VTEERKPNNRKPKSDAAYLRPHRKKPDYERPTLEVAESDRERIREILTGLYEEEDVESCYREIERLMRVFYAHKTPAQIEDDRRFDRTERFTHKTAILTTYGDLIVSDGEPPLRVLNRMLDTYARYITTVHVLPFFPYSSDRGFSITDYEEVDPNLGSWEEIEQLTMRFELMFDGVINHVSSQSRWFQEFLNCNPRYAHYFIGFSTREEVSEDHLKLILRPRASDLLTRVQTLDGPRYVWTTFSADQIDLNYKNPRVLARILDILLLYVRRGADLIRLDAATYLWHELGTSSAHLWETHAIIRLFRTVLDVVAPRVALVTETNVPHEDNVSYFGNGSDEAQMVYNFALPPLVVLTFQTGDSGHLSRWADTLEKVSDTATYLNFLDSHDGIGLLPIQDIVGADEVSALIDNAKEHGGLVSYRVDHKGNKVPYEINITWWSVLNLPDADETLQLQVDRFIASRSIALALRGVPALYLLGVVGSDNDVEAVTSSGEARSINRTALDADALIERIDDHEHRTGMIFRRLGRLLLRRSRCSAFHPNGEQHVLFRGSGLFSVLRVAPDGTRAVVATTNVTEEKQRLELSRGDLEALETGADLIWARSWKDLVSGRYFEGGDDALAIDVEPYEVLWLEARPPRDSDQG